MSITNLEPEKVFYYFNEICKIPHGSRNTKAISDYLVEFAKDHNLNYIQDKSENVIIFKEASFGYEDAAPIIIQGHMDMVCEKENGVDIDFEKDGIPVYVDGDFVTAKGTTLGGDDGIAIAYALAILDSNDIAHPALEVVITVNEEIGMLGAYDIDLSMLKGRKMLNIDSDVEGIFLTSCAGGMSLISSIPVNRLEKTGLMASLTVTGLVGGHSGSEIDKEHANANIIMGRVLNEILGVSDIGLVSLKGGLKDNAIPRESVAELIIDENDKEQIAELIESLNKTLSKEFALSDKNIKLVFETGENTSGQILDYSSLSRIVFYLRTAINGVVNKSLIMDNLVETSLNLGILELTEDSLEMTTSIRSSVSSRKVDLMDRLVTLVEFLGGHSEVEGDYPAWEYKAKSPLREQIEGVYERLFDKKPAFEAIHAGLECGIFSEKLTGLDCVSFGPDNFDIHTPAERLSISSTQRMWNFIIELLKESK